MSFSPGELKALYNTLLLKQIEAKVERFRITSQNARSCTPTNT